LPAELRSLAEILPFRYMVSFPVEVLTGQVSGSEMVTGFLLQGLWLIAALGLSGLVWRSGVRMYTAIGG
jgi:ABC-2 type transport system permease protein